MLLGFGSTIQGAVSLLFSFVSHYFSAPFEHFLRKELSQIFALIPGASHGTTFDTPLLVQYGLEWDQTHRAW
jgi:hypothetical protein